MVYSPQFSGLPRSVAILLAALFRQNSWLHGAMTLPVGSLAERKLMVIIFTSYYQTESQADTEVIFDTNRLWCSKLFLVQELFPDAKIICCVRNMAWIIDSIKHLIWCNVFDVSGIFNNSGERSMAYCHQLSLNNMIACPFGITPSSTRANITIADPNSE